MADIRINALATTATTSASDDYLAIDGSANGTRKLSAFSPTFGGNLTVGGGTGTISNTTASAQAYLNLTNDNRTVSVGIGGSTNGTAAIQNKLYFYGLGGAVLSTWDGSGNQALTGNLTVGGTGTSSVAGTLGVGTASPGSNLSVVSLADATIPALGAKGGQFAFSVSQLYGLNAGVLSTGNTFMQAQRMDGTATAYNLLLQPSGGNLLIGTTTDSANGKLQLATHTTSAGGIGFGSDCALYRAAASTMKLEVGTGVLWFDNGGSGTGGARIIGSSGALNLTSNGANSLYLQTGGTTALTLDSSQRCILAGALRLNNAYTAGAPTATGYVTLQDSAGNTYKVLVGT